MEENKFYACLIRIKSILTKIHVLWTTKLSTLKEDKTQFPIWGQTRRGRENHFPLELIICFQLKVKGSLSWLTGINIHTNLARTQQLVLRSLLKHSLTCLCHFVIHCPATYLLPLSPSLLQLRWESRKERLREKVQQVLEVSFSSLNVPSSSLLDNLQFHLRNFSDHLCPWSWDQRIALGKGRRAQQAPLFVFLLVLLGRHISCQHYAHKGSLIPKAISFSQEHLQL